MHEVLLAFDFGTKRIGVAVGTYADEGRLTTARALTTLAIEANAPRFDAIAALIDEWQPTRLLVGEPRHADGTAHDMTQRCTRFANQLRGRFSRPVELVDERLSSAAAEADLRDAPPGARPGRSHRRSARPPPAGGLDAEAARVILDTWLHTRSLTDTCRQP